MKYDQPELRDRLAAAYALGTLGGAARRRMKRQMQSDAALAASVETWELRLNALAEAMPGVDPPARVWAAIEREIAVPQPTDATVIAFPARDTLKPNRAATAWRGFGLVAAALAASLAIYIAVRHPAAPIDTSPIAVLNDETGHPAFVAMSTQDGKRLILARLGDAAPASGRVYQLWLLPHGGATPRPLGLVPDLRRAVFQLAADDATRLGDADGIAISLEPAGGSPTGLPTGPILFKGGVISD